jgi:hypothetical protein
MCHYPPVFLSEILAHTAPVTAVSAPVFCAGFCAVSALFLRGFCAGFCAVASQSARLHCSRIAVASPHRIAASHRRRIASLHEISGDLQTSLESHLPVVQPTL